MFHASVWPHRRGPRCWSVHDTRTILAMVLTSLSVILVIRENVRATAHFIGAPELILTSTSGQARTRSISLAVSQSLRLQSPVSSLSVTVHSDSPRMEALPIPTRPTTCYRMQVCNIARENVRGPSWPEPSKPPSWKICAAAGRCFFPPVVSASLVFLLLAVSIWVLA